MEIYKNKILFIDKNDYNHFYLYDDFSDASNRRAPYIKNLFIKVIGLEFESKHKLPNEYPILCIDEYLQIKFKNSHLIKVLINSKIFYVYY